MEQYDYRKLENLEEAVYTELETLTPGQRMRVWESILDAKRNAEAERIALGRKWFEQAVLPALRDFARVTSSLLEVDWDGDGSITALLRSSEEFRVQDQCRGLRMALFMAEDILISRDEDELVLTLIYDSRRLLTSL
ncbi:MAG: hypothetical protein KH230_02660 [Enterocloster asparagiformis]|nr:hypothetical protein [Enterocloster asparagiformis]